MFKLSVEDMYRLFGDCLFDGLLFLLPKVPLHTDAREAKFGGPDKLVFAKWFCPQRFLDIPATVDRWTRWGPREEAGWALFLWADRPTRSRRSWTGILDLEFPASRIQRPGCDVGLLLDCWTANFR